MRSRVLMAVAVAALAGCSPGGPSPAPSASVATNGVENLSAQEIIQAASDALAAATSFRVTAEPGAGPQGTSVDLVYAGDSVQGELGIAGLDLSIVKVGEDLFLKAPAALYQQFVSDPNLLAQLDGTWVTMPVAVGAGFLPIGLSVGELFSDERVVPPLTKGPVETRAGQQVVTVTDAADITYSVAIVGEPYVVEVATSSGAVRYSDFNQAVTIEAPAGAFDLLGALP